MPILPRGRYLVVALAVQPLKAVRTVATGYVGDNRLAGEVLRLNDGTAKGLVVLI